MKKILIVFGTRPEAIKLAPLVLEAKKDNRFQTLVCSTGQHREMLKPILNFFSITPDFDLNLMRPGQTLADVSTAVMQGLNEILSKVPVDAVIVQGDTTTCFVSSLVSFYHKIPVIHVEAGLRSGDIFSPFPEEFNRKATGLIAALHFAPTETAKINLIKEHYSPETIYVTGNTGIDALFAVRERFDSSTLKDEIDRNYSFLSKDKKLILATVHRRESFGKPLEEVMNGLLDLAKRDDLEILIPLHMNPAVRESAKKIFGDAAHWVTERSNLSKSKIWLCEPVDYVPFIYLMNRAHVIITDSGGVQEEAPSLGKPILVAREKTERPEAIEAGTSKLVPLERHKFLKSVSDVLDNKEIFDRMAKAQNPFGDGRACARILDILAQT